MATAETIVAKVSNGYPKRIWQPMPGRQNHYLDCRVYNMAAAEKLMLDTLSDADWQRLRIERHAPKDDAQGDLLAMRRTPTEEPGVPAESTRNTSRADEWIEPKKDWL